MKTADLCCEHGISAATFYGWKQKFDDMDITEAQRLKALEDANRRLKFLQGELRLHVEALKGVIRKRWSLPASEAIWRFAYTKDGLSERTAYELLGLERSSYRYEPWLNRNAELRGE